MVLATVALLAHNEIRVAGSVTKVEAGKIVVKTKQGRKFSFAVDKDTEITRDKKKAAVSELKVGQNVVVTACGEKDDLLALKIRIVSATPPGSK